MYGHIHIYPYYPRGWGYGGYGYIGSTAYPSIPQSKKKEYTKESPLEKLFHNVWAYYIHIPTPHQTGMAPNFRWVKELKLGSVSILWL